MKREKMTDAEIQDALNDLNGWQVTDGFLFKRYKFNDFAESLKFVNAIGELAEQADHHPDITFGWGYAEVKLMTHDRDGITDVDFSLASKINGL